MFLAIAVRAVGAIVVRGRIAAATVAEAEMVGASKGKGALKAIMALTATATAARKRALAAQRKIQMSGGSPVVVRLFH